MDRSVNKRGKNSSKGEFPFKIDLSSKAAYVDQLTESVREAIRTGKCRPGDKLPSWDEMARVLGVSRKIPRLAMSALAREGVVVSRPRVGTVVGSRSVGIACKDPVLYVRYEAETGSYFSDVCFGAFRKKLLANGYPTAVLDVPGIERGKFRIGHLERLFRFNYSLVVDTCNNPTIRKWCDGLGAPVLHSSDVNAAGEREIKAALNEFVAHSIRSNIKEIIQVNVLSVRSVPLHACFSGTGVRVIHWNIKRQHGRLPFEGIRNAAEAAFHERILRGRDWLPDLFFFSDDHLASGALTALAVNGVRIPDDVKAVTVANEGNMPVWHGECTAILHRPVVIADRMASSALEKLGERTGRAGSSVPACEYLVGATFPL